MRIITVDNGNTNPHVGIFENQKLEKVIPLRDYVFEKDDFIIVSDVGNPLPFPPSFDLKSKREKNVFFDMPVNYSETLGDDRLIAGYATFKAIKQNETVLLIDAGTFTTMDIISNSGFMGGYIFPGISTFLNSYQSGTQLPTLHMKKEFKLSGLPHTTEDAILGALDIYLIAILKEVIRATSPSKIIITGGSLEIFENKIRSFNLPKVQLETNPHLIHLALHEIFQNHLRSA